MTQQNAPAIYPLTLISGTLRSRPILPYRAPICQCVIIIELKQSVSPRLTHLEAKIILLRALPLTVKFSLARTRLSALTGQMNMDYILGEAFVCGWDRAQVIGCGELIFAAK